MTIVDIRTTGLSLEAEDKQRIASRIVAAFAEVEAGHDDASVHVGFMVLFNEAGDADTYIGPDPVGVATGTGRGVVVRAQVMAGPWDDDLRRDAISSVGSVLRDELGLSGAEIWMTLTEIPDGSWGYGGHPLSIADLAGMFSDERRARIDTHLAQR